MKSDTEESSVLTLSQTKISPIMECKKDSTPLQYEIINKLLLMRVSDDLFAEFLDRLAVDEDMDVDFIEEHNPH